MLQELVLLLLTVSQALRATEGAPAMGDKLVANIQENMDAVHGNIMAGITNLLQPVGNLMDKVPEAFLGKNNNNGIMWRIKDFLEKFILGSAGAFNSAIKLGSTIGASPFKITGDLLSAIEKIALGRNLETSGAATEHKMKKRDSENQIQFSTLIERVIKLFRRFLSGQVNDDLVTNKKSLAQGRILESSMTDESNKDLSQDMNFDEEFLKLINTVILGN